jgi:hypothetical protein
MENASDNNIGNDGKHAKLPKFADFSWSKLPLEREFKEFR